MDRNKRNNSESGQIMILMILAVVGIFAFAALAIDGAMVYSDRRIAQNAADAAANTGISQVGQDMKDVGYSDFDCTLFASGGVTWTNATSAAINNASENDYTIAPYPDFDFDFDHGVTAECFTSPEKYIDVGVRITETTPSSFAHLFFDGPLVNEVGAKSRYKVGKPVGAGNAIISLTHECDGDDKGTFINGTITVTVTSGGIWSNSCLQFKGSSGNVNAGSITFNEDYIPFSSGMTVYPTPVPTDTRLVIDIPQPPCNQFTIDNGNYNGAGTISPGIYSGIHVSSGDLTMNPGLYCIGSGGFTFNGVNMTANDITIALLGDKQPSGLHISGGGIISMTAQLANCDTSDPAYAGYCVGYAVPGLLIWKNPLSEKESGVFISGNSESTFEGTVYAPSALVDIGGTPDTESVDFGLQIIGDSVIISGSADVNILYDEDKIWHYPDTIETAR